MLTCELPETVSSNERKQIKERLIQDLTGALKINLGQYIEDQAAFEIVNGVPAKPDDPSIWASSDLITHQGTLGGMTSVVLPNCPRGYIRIIPAGWKQGIPSVNTSANQHQDVAVQAQAGAYSNGDFGASEQTGLTQVRVPDLKHTSSDDVYVRQGSASKIGKICLVTARRESHRIIRQPSITLD